jgi:hypothetical protein
VSRFAIPVAIYITIRQQGEDNQSTVGASLGQEVRDKGKPVERRGRKANEANAQERHAGRVAEEQK